MKIPLCFLGILVSLSAMAANGNSVTAEQIIDELINKAPDSEKPAFVDKDGLTVPESSPHISVPVYFEYNSAELTEVAKTQINAVAKAIKEMQTTPRLLFIRAKPGEAPPKPQDTAAKAADPAAPAGDNALGPNDKILIDGHTDNRGTKDSNKKLSLDRAQAVRAYLIQQGVDDKVLVARGTGSERPVAPNDSEESRARNRRVDFVRLSHVDAPAPGDDQATLRKIFFPNDVDKGTVKYLDVNFVARARGAEKEIRNKDIKSLTDGDDFRTEIHSLRGCFLNVILKNADGEIEWLYPSATSPTEVWTYANDAVVLPGPTADHWYTADGTKGKETVYVIATEQPIGNHKALKALIKEKGADLTAEMVKKTAATSFAEVHLVAFDHI